MDYKQREQELLDALCDPDCDVPWRRIVEELMAVHRGLTPIGSRCVEVPSTSDTQEARGE